MNICNHRVQYHLSTNSILCRSPVTPWQHITMVTSWLGVTTYYCATINLSCVSHHLQVCYHGNMATPLNRAYCFSTSNCFCLSSIRRSSSYSPVEMCNNYSHNTINHYLIPPLQLMCCLGNRCVLQVNKCWAGGWI